MGNQWMNQLERWLMSFVLWLSGRKMPAAAACREPVKVRVGKTACPVGNGVYEYVIGSGDWER